MILTKTPLQLQYRGVFKIMLLIEYGNKDLPYSANDTPMVVAGGMMSM